MSDKSPSFTHIQLEIGLSEPVSADELAKLFNKIRDVVEARGQTRYCNLTEASANLKHD
jgi:hypothetical protein